MKIKFIIHESRKGKSEGNYNPRLSGYWKMMYYKMFEKWE